MAFNSLLNNMELVKRIYLNASQGDRKRPVTKEEMLHAAQTTGQINPLAVDILFQLAGQNHRAG